MRLRRARLVPFLLVFLLLAGAATLGVLQVRWLDAFSRAEEQRARLTLGAGVGRVHGEAEDQVRVLLSLVRISGEDIRGRSWASLMDSIRFWNESSSHPLLLKNLYIGDLPAQDHAFAWSRESGSVAPALLPQWVGDAVRDDIPAADSHGPRRALFSPEGDPLVILTGYSESRNPTGFVAVVLDAGVLYGRLVPSLMEGDLPGCPFRVLSSGGVLFSSSGDSLGGRTPEISLGLDDLSFSLPPTGPDGDRPDPSMRFWLLESQMSGIGSSPLPPGAPRVSVVKLEVFYPGQSLSAVMHRRWILNLILGVGILGILIGSAVILYRLYRQSARLRASEQEFVSSMSHELRTPLAVIQAASENLSQGAVKDAERLPRYARVINGQVKRLGAMVESILFYSGLESGAGRSPALGDVEPAALADDVVQSLRPLAAEASTQILLDTDGLPGKIRSDATALRLILENLLMNAIRHAAQGEIRLSLARRPFDLLLITVEDDGPGIPAREQARVFEPFVRGERSVKDQTPGSGLGLHLVRRVALMLGGSVKLESPYADLAEAVRRGCRFTVSVPCVEVIP